MKPGNWGWTALAAVLCVLSWVSIAGAQLTDVTQTPNAENEGIKKSLDGQIGAGQGDEYTPGSSWYLIKRDPFRSISRGRQLFQRKFTLAQGNGPRTGDGVGDIETELSHGAGFADSCAACHGRPRGSAGSGGDVFTRPDSRDAPHLFGLGLQEMLADEITQRLREIREDAIEDAIDDDDDKLRTLSAKGIYYGKIRAFPDGSVDTSLVRGVDDDLRVRPFFAHGGTTSIREFIIGAFNAEMGLETHDFLIEEAVGGGSIETPAGMILDGAVDFIESNPTAGPLVDNDGDGVVEEIDPALVDHLEFYLLNYFRPALYRQDDTAVMGRYKFGEMGCATCHKPNLTINVDRRVADVETAYNPSQGAINRLFATATPLFEEVDDDSGHPTLKLPLGGSFVVRDFFADLKRHDLGPAFWERNFDGTIQKEFMTEPLWGVGTTAPYGHDGRSVHLREVILRHGGEAEDARDEFAQASSSTQRAVLHFLNSLVLFGPPDTASNLNPKNPSHPQFPLRGHGSIDLTPLFNDPTEPE